MSHPSGVSARSLVMPEFLSSLLLAPARLQDLLGEARGRFDVDALAECESTNSLLLDRAEQGAPSGSVIVADRQTAGRGSRGRSWLSTPESSLTFSVLWRFERSIEHLSGLSLAVGVAVINALEACGASGVTLKWPNDILYEDAKLGGILIEMLSEEDATLAIIGIGLNLSLPESSWAGDGFALPPAALDEILYGLPDRHALLAELLIELAHVFDIFAGGGFAALRDQWHSRHAWQKRPVSLLRDGKVLKEGICYGADIDGALLLKTEAGIERCLSGDVSLRSAR